MIAEPQRNELVTFELPEYKRCTSEEMDGCEARVEYDSSYGGVQVVEGEAQIVREWENGRRRRYLVVGDRKVASGGSLSSRVFSSSGRKVGTVESITVAMDADIAIEWIASEWHGHDVDAGDGEIYVQFWSSELHDEMAQEKWLNHTDAIRFQIK